MEGAASWWTLQPVPPSVGPQRRRQVRGDDGGTRSNQEIIKVNKRSGNVGALMLTMSPVNDVDAPSGLQRSPIAPLGTIWLLGSGVAGSRSVVAMTTAVANHSLEDKHKQHRDENMREKFLLVFLTFLGEAKAAGEREPGETGHAHNNMDQDGRQDGGRSLRLFMLGSVCPPVRSDGASLKVKCLRADVDVSPGRWFLPMWSWCASGS